MAKCSLLDQQQESAINRLADEMFAATRNPEPGGHHAGSAPRPGTVPAPLARELCRVETSTFVEIIPLLPADYRPLMQSLVGENNSLLQRVQQRARQNHLVLSRSVELMQQFLGTLFRHAKPRSITNTADASRDTLPAPPLYEAIG